MKIDKQELYRLYMNEVNRIIEDDEQKEHFTAKECVDLVALVLEKNPSLVSYPEPQSAENLGVIVKPFNPNKYQLAYMQDLDHDYKGCEYYTLGVLAPDTGAFHDFYYNSCIDPEEYSQLIPKGFSEASESCYEFCHGRNIGTTAREILKKYGYVEVQEDHNISKKQ